MNDNSDGEKSYALRFQFARFVPDNTHDELRDFLYKFAHNYSEAKEYLQILEQISTIDPDVKSELINRIHDMALQSFALALRRMTDSAGKRSAQKLITKVIHEQHQKAELQKIQDIHLHYRAYVDKGVAHQDDNSKKENLSAFPASNVVEADMEYLSEFYLKIVKEICTDCINITDEPYDYSHELNKLLEPGPKHH
jgi:hypothetical protein